MAKRKSTMARIGIDTLEKVRKLAKKRKRFMRDTLDDIVEGAVKVEESERGA